MSDSPDRTPHDAGEAGPRPTPGEASRPGEEPTQVHRTAEPGRPDGRRQDSSITAFTPGPGPEPSAPGTGSAAAAAEPAAQVAPQAVPRKVSVRNRGRMRRRLRYLRRVRELGYRDLGGLVFELRRAGVENEVLVGAKVDALHSIDQELHVLEHGLRDFLSVEELHEPGVSVCLRCGALHGSDANFCPQCGIRVDQQQTGHAPADPATVAAAPGAGTTGSYPGATSATGSERR
ncbi:zinc ribbon domain-containing protein [Patulibacter sp.]|uniref:zinc ribbon domain-containing protein n=1 Tax=Patulibacter sp. TaxID=1912859 RepID=UPI0027244372|nr:zinc ribbon domain-containing protein [Patulibacter sp.]MDO9409118.1 zinc ribbon domain-containing protein [Patulibacter sp.]